MVVMYKKKISPYLLIILSYIIVILIGTVLLILPFATGKGVSFDFFDAIFMSTSSVCVTGLIPVGNLSESFTLFGKIVILILVQIGGLGFVTITIFMFSVLGLKIGMNDRFLIKESFNQNSSTGMVKLVVFAVKTTMFFQIIGAVINFIVIKQYYPFWEASGMSIFHSIISFNNAGFDIFPPGISQQILINHPLLLINTSILVIIGGIGFIVIDDIIRFKKNKRLSIHTKIVLKTTLLIIVIGTILLKIFEPHFSFFTSFFTIIGARTFGLGIINFNLLSNSAYIMILMIMFIGASPSSTGGGIKTTTFYTIIKSIIAFAKGKKPITHNREISNQSILKAFVIIVFSVSFVFIIVFLISIIEYNNFSLGINQQQTLSKITFEVFSAFATTGFTSEIITDLSIASEMLIVLTMFIGRVGVITFISIWNRNIHKNNIQYIEERIIVG